MESHKQNKKRATKEQPVEITAPELASVERMKIIERSLMDALTASSKEAKENGKGEFTVYEIMKVLSKVQHHYSGIGVEFQWEDANARNTETIESAKTIQLPVEKQN